MFTDNIKAGDIIRINLQAMDEESREGLQSMGYEGGLAFVMRVDGRRFFVFVPEVEEAFWFDRKEILDHMSAEIFCNF